MHKVGGLRNNWEGSGGGTRGMYLNLERWNGGMPERWNAGTPEYLNQERRNT